VLGPELLQFGSDCFLPCSSSHLAERIGWVEALFDELELDPSARARIWAGTAAAWLKLEPDSTPIRPERRAAAITETERFGGGPPLRFRLCC